MTEVAVALAAEPDVSPIVLAIEAKDFEKLAGGQGVAWLNELRTKVRAGVAVDDRTLRAAMALLQSGTKAIEGKKAKAAGGTSRSAKPNLASLMEGL
jgi:hypothetical protein